MRAIATLVFVCLCVIAVELAYIARPYFFKPETRSTSEYLPDLYFGLLDDDAGFLPDLKPYEMVEILPPIPSPFFQEYVVFSDEYGSICRIEAVGRFKGNERSIRAMIAFQDIYSHLHRRFKIQTNHKEAGYLDLDYPGEIEVLRSWEPIDGPFRDVTLFLNNGNPQKLHLDYYWRSC